VRKVLVLGAVLAAVAGAVFAAAPPDPKVPPEPPQPPVVADRAAEPQPKAAPDPQPGEEHARAPHITAGWDIPLTNARRVVWSPSGSRLAVLGRKPHDAHSLDASEVVLLKYSGKAEPEDVTLLSLPRNVGLIGFSSDGTQLVTDRRESGLLSGLHQLVYWDPEKKRVPPRGTDPGSTGGNGAVPLLDAGAKLRTVSFDGAGVDGYAFAPDGKAFRAVRMESEGARTANTMEVIEIDAVTGQAGKPLLQVNYGRHAFSPDGKRIAVCELKAPTVRVYDLENRAKPELCRFTFTGEAVPLSTDWSALLFSPDGNRLVLSYGYAEPVILNVRTGKPTVALGAYVLQQNSPWSSTSFSSDGRLLASLGYSFRLKKREVNEKDQLVSYQERFLLAVWDTATGRVLKSWPVPVNNTPALAFHPSRPLLVIAEPNGDGETRLGFWDFAAEPKKK
jgi:WD40 repeat protein